MIRMMTVLVATDFSEPAGTALKYGREFALRFGARLQLLHVTDNAYASLSPAEGVLPVSGITARWSAHPDPLDELSAHGEHAELDAQGIVRDSNDIPAAILAYATECRADLLVIGTHAHGGLARLVAGRVADKVLRAAPCPVLVVHQPEHEFIVPGAR